MIRSGHNFGCIASFGFCPVYPVGVVYPPSYGYPVYDTTTYITSPAIASGYGGYYGGYSSGDWGGYSGVGTSEPIFENNVYVTNEADADRAGISPPQVEQDIRRYDTSALPEPYATAEAPDSQAAPGNAPNQKLNRWMIDGAQAFSQGKYEDAAVLFLRVTMADPTNADSGLAYAVARFATGNYGSAALAIRRSVRRVPEVLSADFDIRDRYGDVGDFDRQLKRLEGYVRERPDVVDGWVVLGFIRHFTGQRELAGRTFEVVRRQSQEDADVAELFLNAPLPEEEQLPPGQGSDGAQEGADEETSAGEVPVSTPLDGDNGQEAEADNSVG